MDETQIYTRTFHSHADGLRHLAHVSEFSQQGGTSRLVRAACDDTATATADVLLLPLHVWPVTCALCIEILRATSNKSV
jgi:hypothetical protein